MDILDICVTRTLECGVVPIELGLRPMYDCYYSNTVGYRGRAYINSILYGSLGPDDYTDALEHDKIGEELAKRNLRTIVRALPKFAADTSRLELVSLRCPAIMLENDSIYDLLHSLGRGVSPKYTKKMCLEFSENILKGNSRHLCRMFADIRAAGWKIAVDNYGSHSFPMAALADTAPDAVYMRPETVKMLSDRDRSKAVASFVRFATGLGVRVIADGAADDGQIRELNSSECFAYMPSAEYSGNQPCVSSESDLSSLIGIKGGNESEI